MSKYMLLCELAEGSVEQLREDPDILQDVEDEIESLGGNVIKQYILLGAYDIMYIIEAPDNETVARVAVELGTRLKAKSQTLPAISAEDLAAGF